MKKNMWHALEDKKFKFVINRVLVNNMSKLNIIIYIFLNVRINYEEKTNSKDIYDIFFPFFICILIFQKFWLFEKPH